MTHMTIFLEEPPGLSNTAGEDSSSKFHFLHKSAFQIEAEKTGTE